MSILDVPIERSALVQAFPFPFDGDRYRYSANVEPALTPVRTHGGSWGTTRLHVDDHYVDDLRERARILDRDPSRSCERPHMRSASWDTMLWAMGELAADHPDVMSLEQRNGGWLWRNRLLDVEQPFTYGDDASLPLDPLRFVGTQVQEDLVLLDQRDGALWADAGLVTFAADWSMRFDLGMAFVDIHRPVPRLVPEDIIPRAQQFLLRLQAGEDFRRTNWTVTATPRLDVSTETYDEWGATRRQAELSADPSELLHLRVEVQHFVRLAPSGALLFTIRTYLLRFDELASVPQWRAQLGAVLAELPADLVDYKGLTRFRDVAVSWLLS